MFLFRKRKGPEQVGKELLERVRTYVNRPRSNDAKFQSVLGEVRPSFSGSLPENSITEMAVTIAEGAEDIDSFVKTAKQDIPLDVLTDSDSDVAKADRLLSYGTSLPIFYRGGRYVYYRAVFDAAVEAKLTGFLFRESGKQACSFLLVASRLQSASTQNQLALWACEKMARIGKSIGDAYFECRGLIGLAVLLAQNLIEDPGNITPFSHAYSRGLKLVPHAEAQRSNDPQALQALRDDASKAKKLWQLFYGSTDPDEMLNNVAEQMDRLGVKKRVEDFDIYEYLSNHPRIT